MQAHIFRLLATAAALTSSFTALAAQAAAGDQPPLEVERVIIQSPEGERHLWRVKNVSQKDVSAFVACIHNEKGLCVHMHTTIYATRPGPSGRLRPGETREEPPPKLAGAAPAKAVARPTLDYVLFADGSAWGPDSRGQSHVIRAAIAAARGTLAWLKRVLDTQGINAVVEILNTAQEP
jgi:hypothetical protein